MAMASAVLKSKRGSNESDDSWDIETGTTAPPEIPFSAFATTSPEFDAAVKPPDTSLPDGFNVWLATCIAVAPAFNVFDLQPVIPIAIAIARKGANVRNVIFDPGMKEYKTGPSSNRPA
jgi:hypothetical protein